MTQSFSPCDLRSLWMDRSKDCQQQDLLDALSQKKLSWEEFESHLENLSSFSRLASTDRARTLLHLAVLDRRLDLVVQLAEDPSLLNRTDAFGLSSLDLAKLLDDQEMIALLNRNRFKQLEQEIPQSASETEIVPKSHSFCEMPPNLPFSYLSHPVFSSKEDLEEVLKTVAKAKKEDKILSEKIWMGIYFDKEIRNEAHSSIEIRHIDPEVGFGVFAKKSISPCSFVGEYTGVIACKKPKELQDKRHVVRYPVWEGKKNYCIDAEKRGNFTRLINHSETPNLGLQSVYWRGIPRMIFISLKEIREGTQLTFDYGPIFWKNHPQTPKILA